MDITAAQFWNVPNVQGYPTFSYAELLAQLQIDIPSGGALSYTTIGYTGPQQVTLNVQVVTITFTDLLFDNGLGAFNIANPTRLTVPTGVTGIMLIGYCAWTNVTSGGTVRGFMTKNGKTLARLASR